MPFVDSTAAGDALMASLLSLPDGEVALYADLPTDPANELDATGGYARASVSAADWVQDGTQASMAVAFADATDAWLDQPVFWGWLVDDVLLFFEPLLDPEEVTGAGEVSQTLVTAWRQPGDEF